MEHNLFAFFNFPEIFSVAKTWMIANIFIRDGLYQIGIIIILYFFSYLLSSILKKNKYISSLKIAFPITKIFLPFIFLIFVSIANYLVGKIGWKNPLLNIANNLVLAFVMIKIFSYFFRKNIWFKFFRTILWIIIILNIFDLLDDLTTFLESIRFSYGENELTLLLLFKGVIILFIAIWLALRIADFLQKKIDKSKDLNPSLKVLLNKSLKIILLFIASLFGLNVIGVKLTTFAVLGGAVGVGIGFGLQKIVSNYTSGFILLLDKSIKPGDVIEIDDTFGNVKSMSARYITLSTIEGKEHLIPNENLITQKVINWSHTDRMIRLKILVGVSYDTDIPKAMQLMKEAALQNQRIIRKNEISVFLTEFNSSSIDLEIRFWIQDPEKGLANIQSDVRLDIWKKFKDHNIEIPFPQNDVYIKSMPEKKRENDDLSRL